MSYRCDGRYREAAALGDVMSSRKKTLVDAILGEQLERVPVASVTQTGIVELMEITGAEWPAAHSDPALMADLSYSAYSLIGFESVRVPFCVTVLAEALGCDVEMGTISKQPAVVSHPYATLPDTFELPVSLSGVGRIPVVLEAVRKLRELTKGDVAVVAGFEGPVTLAADLVGTERFMIWTLKHPERVERVLEHTTAACQDYAALLGAAGADVICVADPVASPELLSPTMFQSMLQPYITDLGDSIDTPSVLHICGNVNRILGSMAQCGFDALSIEEKVRDIEEAQWVTGDRARLIGNISCAFTLLDGTPDKVREEALYCLRSGIDVLAPGCGLAPATPIANCRALIKARDELYE